MTTGAVDIKITETCHNNFLADKILEDSSKRNRLERELQFVAMLVGKELA